jgi:phosphoribosylformylglycinamidine cyclo-ligase
VDVAAGDRLVERIKPLAAATRRPEIVAGVGGFAALFRVPKRYKRPLLVAGTDGVGTKLRLAFLLNRHDTIGIDLVAMSVNDVLTIGAEPLTFLDYLATGKLRPGVATQVIAGIAEGCRQAGCALIGGETAEMPSFYAPGEYDAAGFAVGVVEAARVVDGRSIRPGDAVVGLASNGLHSNGFALVRHLVLDRARLSLRQRPPGFAAPLGPTLLTPTRIYVKPVLEVLRHHRVKGMAHITGGGLTGNVPRILPDGCEAVIDRYSWPVPHVFPWLQRLGGIREAEMYRTFNMGIGFVLVVGRREVAGVCRRLVAAGEHPFEIGAIKAGRRRVRYVGGGGRC